MTIYSMRGLSGPSAADAAALAAVYGKINVKALLSDPKANPAVYKQLAQSAGDIQKLAKQLPPGIDPQALLNQAGVTDKLSSLLGSSGIAIPGGAGAIGAGVLKIGDGLFSGKADVGDVALEVNHVAHDVLTQMGGPLSQLGDVGTGILTDALKITGVGSQIGGTTGTAIGTALLGTAGGVAGNTIGQLIGGGAESAFNALGIGEKAARLDREKGREKNDDVYTAAAMQRWKNNEATLYQKFMSGDVILTFGVPGTQKVTERKRFHIVKGKFSPMTEQETAAYKGDGLLLASNNRSKAMFDRMQAYEKKLVAARQKLAGEIALKANEDAKAKLAARKRVVVALSKAVAHQKKLAADKQAAKTAAQRAKNKAALQKHNAEVAAANSPRAGFVNGFFLWRSVSRASTAVKG